MGKLSVVEYANVAKDGNGVPMQGIGQGPGIISEFDFTTAAASVAFSTGTRFIRLCSEIDAYLLFAAVPVADVDDIFLPADTVAFFDVVVGEKVSAYDGSS